MIEYAMYNGDKFIDLGTIDYLSEKYKIKKTTLRCYATPSRHKGGRKKLLYRIEEDK
ncbi:hypothetical protein [Lactobacillus sp. PV034]|uniref:hypothetical protein n=1 Tax=Lactobacillus sp. PV034 TaxID=2594495 RepID=UPI00223FD3FF|nr:hypothetical protein [Lactobacillus sp. PV034]